MIGGAPATGRRRRHDPDPRGRGAGGRRGCASARPPTRSPSATASAPTRSTARCSARAGAAGAVSRPELVCIRLVRRGRPSAGVTPDPRLYDCPTMGRDVFYITTPIYYSERRAAHRPRVHVRGRRRHRPVPPAPRRGGLPPHRDGRARPEAPAGGRGGGPGRPGLGRRDGAEVAGGLGAARDRLRRLHPHHRAAARERRHEVPHRRARQRRARTSTSGPTRASYCVSCEAYYTEDELVDGTSARSTTGRSST